MHGGLDVVAKQLRKWCGITSVLGQHLRHSEKNKRTIDAIFMDPSRPEQWPTCCDNTCISPMLPSFVRYTFRTTESAAGDRKKDKHERECIAIERHFVAAVLTTAGSMGCKPFLDWWDAIWRQASYQHVRPDVTAYDIYTAKQHTEASLHAVIVRHCAMATEYLKTPAAPTTRR